MTELSGSASFEPGIELAEPSAKRARFETTDLAPEPVTEIAVTEEVQPGDEEVHLTVPQTQFEIEINSGSVEDDDGVVRETILQQDLNGPAFAITTASQVGVVSCVMSPCIEKPTTSVGRCKDESPVFTLLGSTEAP